MEQMLAQAATLGMAAAVIPLVLVIYFFGVWDARRDGSPAAEDTQIGVKVAVHVFALVAILIAAQGANQILGFILGKIKGGASSAEIKMGIGNLIVGGGVFFACWQVLLPRTNWQEHEKITRLTVGALAAISGIIAITTFASFVANLIGGMPWGMNHPNLSLALVFGALGFLSLNRLGTMSGWVAPPPKAPGGFGDPGAGGGYDPNQQYQQPQQPPPGGYPPAGGAPPAGGYPPAGGGYPPGGGAPPAGGGGFPPQGGGGGLPPPSGGGY